MKKLFIILIMFILTSAISCNKKVKCDCSKDNICVSIINSTEQTLEKVSLLSHGINQAAIEKLATGDDACLSIKSPGENSISLTAILSNGKTVLSKELYSEGGYKFTAIIVKEEIKIEYSKTY